MTTNKIYNFGAGPACLPQEVLNQIKADIPDWYDGMSVMELSHRLPVFMELTQTIEADLRQLLEIPNDFAVLFMHGGARTQFAAVPLNLLQGAKTADYLVTGIWSSLAYDEAKKYTNAHCVASGESNQFTQIPQSEEWVFTETSPYLHYTDNETIQGVEFHHVPKCEGKWLVSDMTSNILTKPISFENYGAIYASAQKNLGIAGITVVIVRKELLGKTHAFTPSMLDYTVYEKSHSLYNTPPMFCWYVLGLMLKWTKTLGSCEDIASTCREKANLIYDVIDNSGFYTSPIYKAHRSRMNIPFCLPTEELEQLFLQKANEHGLKQLKGHKLVGGCRASIYNAMPVEGVIALRDFMKSFENTYG
ncbi:MAG: 3-phosphoserine/phosphohydroxythreonine transaminase [Proteobacteria bacterium]|nr:3-phosphoserine/phosphohydroxythreonine transaminase [Pseudomonadota bacterium]